MENADGGSLISAEELGALTAPRASTCNPGDILEYIDDILEFVFDSCWYGGRANAGILVFYWIPIAMKANSVFLVGSRQIKNSSKPVIDSEDATASGL